MDPEELKAQTKQIALQKLEVLEEQLAEIFMELPVSDNVQFDPQFRARVLMSAAKNGIESL